MSTMPFTKISKRPPRSDMLTRDMLALITEEHVEREAAYWRDIRALDGLVQISVADAMLRSFVEPARLARMSALLVTHSDPLRRAAHIDVVEKAGPVALAGFSLSRLIRLHFDESIRSAQHAFQNPASVATEIVANMNTAVFNLHCAVGVASEVLPDFVPGSRAQFYDDGGDLVVTALNPAVASDGFRNHVGSVSDVAFDPEQYVTLRPQLKSSFVAPLAAA